MNITAIFVDLLFNKYNYQGRLFPSLGNHEMNVCDMFPLDSTKDDFLQKYSDIISPYVFKTDKEKADFLNFGFYSSLFKDNLRIISLNSLLCDTMNFLLIQNPTDPGNQVSWLENELRTAEKNNEKVIIIGHIPLTHSTFPAQCSLRLNALIDRFSDTIIANLFGHTHEDGFHIVTEYFNSTNPISICLTTPSLTTYSYKNPRFRVYELNSSTKIINNFNEYFLNLTLANSLIEEKPMFDFQYSGIEVI